MQFQKSCSLTRAAVQNGLLHVTIFQLALFSQGKPQLLFRHWDYVFQPNDSFVNLK